MAKIISSAIKFKLVNDSYWAILTGKRHPDILEKMFQLRLIYDKNTAIQGFLTDDDRFVDRFEAMEIAMQANQISENILKEIERTKQMQLYSEDIWIEEGDGFNV